MGFEVACVIRAISTIGREPAVRQNFMAGDVRLAWVALFVLFVVSVVRVIVTVGQEPEVRQNFMVDACVWHGFRLLVLFIDRARLSLSLLLSVCWCVGLFVCPFIVLCVCWSL